MHFFHLEGFFFHLCHSFDFVLTLCVSVWKRCALRPWLMRCRSWRHCRKIQELWCMGRGEGRSSWIHNKTEQAKTADQQGSPPSVNDPTGCSPGSGLILYLSLETHLSSRKFVFNSVVLLWEEERDLRYAHNDLCVSVLFLFVSFPVVWPREPSSWRTSLRRAPSVCTGPTPCSRIYSVRQRHTCASPPTGTRTQTHVHVLHSTDITDRLMQNHWCTHTLPSPSAASKCRFTLKRKGLWMCNCRLSQMYKSEPKPMKIWWGWFLTAADSR